LLRGANGHTFATTWWHVQEQHAKAASMFTPESPRNALGSKAARLKFVVEAFQSELEAPSDLPCPDEEAPYSLERWGVAS
jgi:hypothetical protein